MNDKKRHTFEVSHAYHIGPIVTNGPMASMYRGTWGTFDLPVYFRTYESLDSLGLITADFNALMERLRAGRPPRGKHLPEVYETIESREFRVVQAMRLPVGQTLFERLRKQEPLDLERTSHIIGAVAGALRSCRSQGQPHRGPTADRVWLGEDNEVLLLGYGEVLHYGEGISARSRRHPHLLWHAPPEALEAAGTGTRTGSFSAVARARIANNHELEETPQAEVYTLACLAYHCLRGVHPFFWEPTDVSAGIEATLSPPPPRIEQIPEDHPALAVIARGMAFVPELRHETPAEFAHEFHTAVEASAAPRTYTIPTGRIALNDTDDEDSGLQPIMTSSADDDSEPETESRSAAGARPVSDWLWPLSTAILLLGIIGALIVNQFRPASLVILTNPPGVLIEEMVGHTAVELGETPVIVPRSNLLEPLLIRAVGPNGERGEPTTLHPTEFDDLGRCRSVGLHLDTD